MRQLEISKYVAKNNALLFSMPSPDWISLDLVMHQPRTIAQQSCCCLLKKDSTAANIQWKNIFVIKQRSYSLAGLHKLWYVLIS